MTKIRSTQPSDLLLHIAQQDKKIAELEGLVQEIIPSLESYRGIVQDEYKCKTPQLDELLNRPLVREIMEEVEGG